MTDLILSGETADNVVQGIYDIVKTFGAKAKVCNQFLAWLYIRKESRRDQLTHRTTNRPMRFRLNNGRSLRALPSLPRITPMPKAKPISKSLLPCSKFASLCFCFLIFFFRASNDAFRFFAHNDRLARLSTLEITFLTSFAQ